MHVIAYERWKGTWALPDRNCLDGATGSALESMHYQSEPGPDALIYAAFLLRNVAMKHCLADGNKRVAWLAFVEALLIAGLHIDATDEDAEHFVKVTVIENKATPEEIAIWAASRLIAA